ISHLWRHTTRLPAPGKRSGRCRLRDRAPQPQPPQMGACLSLEGCSSKATDPLEFSMSWRPTLHRRILGRSSLHCLPQRRSCPLLPARTAESTPLVGNTEQLPEIFTRLYGLIPSPRRLGLMSLHWALHAAVLPLRVVLTVTSILLAVSTTITPSLGRERR